MSHLSAVSREGIEAKRGFFRLFTLYANLHKFYEIKIPYYSVISIPIYKSLQTPFKIQHGTLPVTTYLALKMINIRQTFLRLRRALFVRFTGIPQTGTLAKSEDPDEVLHKPNRLARCWDFSGYSLFAHVMLFIVSCSYIH